MSTHNPEVAPPRARFGRPAGKAAAPRSRTASLAVAVVLALLAGALTLARGSGGAEPAAAVQAKALVATSDIPAGTPAAQALDLMKLRPLDRSDLVPGAVADPARLSGLVATQPIYAGEQVSLRRFGGGGIEGVRAGLTGTERALAIAGTPQQLLTGTLRRDDRVDVVASLDYPEASGKKRTRIVLRNLLVLAVPETDPAASANSASATLRVTDDQATRLFHVMRNADWSLMLRPPVRARNGGGAVQGPDTLIGGRP
jgi:pilus assembly protein CpaB